MSQDVSILAWFLRKMSQLWGADFLCDTELPILWTQRYCFQ